MEYDQLIAYSAELQNIAQEGLYYGHDIYDRQRYQRIREIAVEIMACQTDTTAKQIKDLFCSDYGYPTPKIDTRAAIFKEDKILLVQEKDKRWTLPGGWCEQNLSPKENVIKEVKEEAGREVKPLALIAVQSKNKHNPRPYIYEVVKFFYLCQEIKGEFQENIETINAEYFKLENIPSLSEEKCSYEQMRMCFDAHNNPGWNLLFD